MQKRLKGARRELAGRATTQGTLASRSSIFTLAAVRFRLLHGVDYDDVRVIQRGDSLGLRLEPCETFLIRREVFGQHLNGNIALLEPR